LDAWYIFCQQGRITIELEWAKLIDFEARVPSAQAELLAQQAGND
jgi:hypothetical protein